MLSGKTFLVTGATGRLGSAMTARLEELGARVLPLVLDGYPPRPKRNPWTARLNPIEVYGERDLDNLPRPGYAIHLHWKVERTRPSTDQILYELDWNIHRPAFLWSWLRESGVDRLINCSSIKVFSHLNDNPISCQVEPRPIAPYGIAKLAGEKFFDAWFAGTRTSVVHIRLCSVYSHGEHPSHLVSQLAAGAFERRRIVLNTGHVVNLIYIDEAIDLIISAALTATRDRYLVVAPGRRVDEVARVFESLAGRLIDAEYVDLAPGVPDCEFVSDLDELRADWVRITPLEKGLTQVLVERNRGQVNT